MKPPGWSGIDPYAPGSRAVNVIVETAAGSRSKFRFDERNGVFLLHKLLPVGYAFPFDFGFIPGTRSDDGDPIDIMLLGEEPTFVGCVVTTRVLGVIEAEQTEGGVTIRNDRLIGTPQTPKIHPKERSLKDVPARLLDQIEHFFVTYNQAEGRDFVVLRRRGPQAALRAVAEAAERHRDSATARKTR